MKLSPFALTTLYATAYGAEYHDFSYCNANLDDLVTWSGCCAGIQPLLRPLQCQSPVYQSYPTYDYVYHFCSITGSINDTEAQCKGYGNYLGDLQVNIVNDTLYTTFVPQTVTAENYTSAVCQFKSNYYNIYVNTPENIPPCIPSDDPSDDAIQDDNSEEHHSTKRQTAIIAASVVGSVICLGIFAEQCCRGRSNPAGEDLSAPLNLAGELRTPVDKHGNLGPTRFAPS